MPPGPHEQSSVYTSPDLFSHLWLCAASVHLSSISSRTLGVMNQGYLSSMYPGMDKAYSPDTNLVKAAARGWLVYLNPGHVMFIWSHDDLCMWGWLFLQHL